MLYLAEKSKQFISNDFQLRHLTLQWLFWQMAGLGPMCGQKVHFTKMASENIPYAVERFSQEVTRLFGVLNRQLHQNQFIAGEYSIADMACYPWVAAYDKIDIDLDQYPHIKRWFLTIQSRAAVQRAYEIAKEINPQ